MEIKIYAHIATLAGIVKGKFWPVAVHFFCNLTKVSRLISSNFKSFDRASYKTDTACVVWSYKVWHAFFPFSPPKKLEKMHAIIRVHLWEETQIGFIHIAKYNENFPKITENDLFF